MKLYLDMDGVLADFDRAYLEKFGVAASKEANNVDWALVKDAKNFYAGIPPMADLAELWEYAKAFNPTVLTGIPRPESVPEAADNKRAWVAKHLGPDVPVIATRSSAKATFAKPGDVLVDDWTKYRKKWIRAGGIWITHTSAAETITELRRIL